MGALTHNGEILQVLPADASQVNFNNTGTDLNSTQTENAIKEVNTKANTNTEDINQLKSGLNGKAVVPTSATKLATMTGGSSQNFTVSDNGYLAISGGTGASQNTFSALVRDGALVRYGVYINATIPPYSSETIGGLYVKKGRTYNVRNIGETDIDVHLCV